MILEPGSILQQIETTAFVASTLQWIALPAPVQFIHVRAFSGSMSVARLIPAAAHSGIGQQDGRESYWVDCTACPWPAASTNQRDI
jgi:hypothetical protein